MPEAGAHGHLQGPEPVGGTGPLYFLGGCTQRLFATTCPDEPAAGSADLGPAQSLLELAAAPVFFRCGRSGELPGALGGPCSGGLAGCAALRPDE